MRLAIYRNKFVSVPSLLLGTHAAVNAFFLHSVADPRSTYISAEHILNLLLEMAIYFESVLK